jgi:AGZA family xanthine/uracil permease-like MFS transporter
MIENYFQLKGRGSSLKIEMIAGMTTFLTMAYIIFVNPAILSLEGVPVPPETGLMNKQALIVATCLVTAIATIAVGIFANAPLAMAPGMGLNAFFAYSLVLNQGISWQTALGVVFVSGFLFMILTLVGLRRKLVESIPPSLIAAISVGIGLFITFIGLVNLGLVVGNEATLVTAGPLTPTVLIGLGGLCLMIFLEIRKFKGALLAGIFFSTLLGLLLGKIDRPETLISFQPLDISQIAFQLDIPGALKWGLVGSIFSLMFMDMFDSIGTLVACCHQGDLVDEEGNIEGLDRLLELDAAATMVGATLGTSTTTAFIESTAGIEQGGRTGLTSVVTGLLFLLAILFVPMVGVVPAFATGPALIMVGLFMSRQLGKINFEKIEEGFPAFIIIVMIALSFSISSGLAFGFIAYSLIQVVSGRIGEIKPAMWLITLLSILFLLPWTPSGG